MPTNLAIAGPAHPPGQYSGLFIYRSEQAGLLWIYERLTPLKADAIGSRSMVPGFAGFQLA
jgi:hypothetical protein